MDKHDNHQNSLYTRLHSSLQDSQPRHISVYLSSSRPRSRSRKFNNGKSSDGSSDDESENPYARPPSHSTLHTPESDAGSQCGIPASASCRSPFPSSAECDKRPVPKELIDQRRHTLPGGVAIHWTCVCCKKEYKRTMIQQWEIFYLLNGQFAELVARLKVLHNMSEHEARIAMAMDDRSRTVEWAQPACSCCLFTSTGDGRMLSQSQCNDPKYNIPSYSHGS